MTGRLLNGHSRFIRPALDENALAVRIQSDDDSITVVSPKESAERVFMAKSERAQNDATHSTIEQLAHICFTPQPPSHLDGNLDPLRNPHEHLSLRTARQRGIEINDVERPGSFAFPPEGRRQRIVTVDRHLRRITATQSDDPPVENINGHKNIHHTFARRKKFRRIFRPVGPDFSGWNWVPKRLPRPTMAGKRIP